MSLLCKWSVHRRRHYMALVVRALQLFFRGSGAVVVRVTSASVSCALVGVGVAHLWQYVKLRAPLWLVTLR